VTIKVPVAAQILLLLAFLVVIEVAWAQRRPRTFVPILVFWAIVSVVRVAFNVRKRRRESSLVK